MPQSSADLAKQFGGVASADLAKRFGGSPVETAAPQTDSWLDTAKKLLNAIPGVPHPDDLGKLAEWLPAVGGAVGGVAGAAGGGPVGAVGGAALGGAAGEGARQVFHELTGGPVPTTGQVATGLATQAALQGGSELAGGLIAPVATRAAGALMQSAVKPGLKATAKAFAKGVTPEDLPVVKTLLKEGVNVSPGGIAKLDRIINTTNADIRSVLDSSSATILPSKVAARTQDVAARVANQVDPQADVAAVQGVTDRFLSQPKTSQLVQTGTKQVPTGVLDASGQMTTKAAPVMGRAEKPITLADAQDMKTGTYRALKEKAYGELKGPEIEAQKALARGLKEEIEQEAANSGVDISALNAREGASITARDAIARRIAAAGNRDPVSLAWLAHNPTASMLFVMERSPAVKSMLARGLYQSASRAARVPENVIRTLVSAIAQQDDSQ
jgi:hypothetical protein